MNDPAAPPSAPVPRDGDVLVRVHAASVHPGDSYVVSGVPYVLRLAFGLRRPGRGIPGRDLAGRVEAVGADVRGLRPGDAVFGWTATGSLAEYVAAPAASFVPKPERLTMEQAATLATSGLTALQALRDVARGQPGQSVLITGASGGVGSFDLQIAKGMGAKVTGVCSTRNVPMVRALVRTARADPRGARAVALHAPAAATVPVGREARRPACARGARRSGHDHAGRRPNLPARADRGRPGVRGRRSCTGQGRGHRWWVPAWRSAAMQGLTTDIFRRTQYALARGVVSFRKVARHCVGPREQDGRDALRSLGCWWTSACPHEPQAPAGSYRRRSATVSTTSSPCAGPYPHVPRGSIHTRSPIRTRTCGRCHRPTPTPTP